MRTIPMPRHLLLIALLAMSGGCLYRMPIQQGNRLDPKLVAQLESGMTRTQVQFLLGTPMVPNGFNTDRWDYFFYFKTASGEVLESQHLTVWFKDDKLDHLEGDAAPKTGPLAAPAVAAPATPASG